MLALPWWSTPNLAPAPIAVAAWAVVSLAATSLGLSALKLVHFSIGSRAYRLLLATGLGYVLLAYLNLALGLLHALTLPLLGAVIVVAFLLGITSIREVASAVLEAFRRLFSSLRFSPFRLFYAAAAFSLLFTFFAALGPSDGRDWDGLSEHLAQAKAYLADHCVEPLWYDHHSEFPSTTEMLYTVGLAFGGQGASKLFHWGFGLLALLAVWTLTRRHIAPGAAPGAVWVVATMPIILWLSTVAFVDLPEVFFTILALDALLTWRRDGRPPDLYLAALAVGCGMAVKMQGLFTLAVLGVVVIFWAVRLRRPAAPVLASIAIALAICCPWYIKSFLVTGNPFYPFGYGIFGGKQWSAQQARDYAYQQATYGYTAPLPPQAEWEKLPALTKRFLGPRSPLMLLLAPVMLTFQPQYYEPRQPLLTALLMFSIGPMYLALAILPFVLPKPRAPAVAQLAALFLLFWILWLESTQLVRYLLPWLAFLAPLCGLALADLLDQPGPLRALASTVVVLWSLIALYFIGIQALPLAEVALGVVPADSYLRAACDVYEPSDFINHSTPPTAKIGTYGEPRVFYLDRDRIWADPGHSLLIDYKSATTPDRLVAEYRRLGLTHLLINQQFFGPVTSSPEAIHRLMAEAVDRHLLEPVNVFQRGRYVLLRVTPP
jgi:hypothetical protein